MAEPNDNACSWRGTLKTLGNEIAADTVAGAKEGFYGHGGQDASPITGAVGAVIGGAVGITKGAVHAVSDCIKKPSIKPPKPAMP